MNIECTATNGPRCAGESHRFRIGVDSRQVTEFATTAAQFRDALTNAVIDHVSAKRPGHPAAGLYLQVWCGDGGCGWRNVQNPASGGVMAVTHLTPGNPETCDALFMWACNSVQMARDIDVIVGGLAREASE